MKSVAILLSILVSIPTLANIITDSETKLVYQYLNNICPDTYCGGEFNYYLNIFKCNKNECLLDITVHIPNNYTTNPVSSEDIRVFKLDTPMSRINVTDIYSVGDFCTDETTGCLDKVGTFACNLKEVTQPQYPKDYFYNRLLDHCIDHIESFLYKNDAK